MKPPSKPRSPIRRRTTLSRTKSRGLVEGYSANFAEHCRQLGRIPTDILRTKPRWPIEAVAMRLTTETIQAALADR